MKFYFNLNWISLQFLFDLLFFLVRLEPLFYFYFFRSSLFVENIWSGWHPNNCFSKNLCLKPQLFDSHAGSNISTTLFVELSPVVAGSYFLEVRQLPLALLNATPSSLQVILGIQLWQQTISQKETHSKNTHTKLPSTSSGVGLIAAGLLLSTKLQTLTGLTIQEHMGHWGQSFFLSLVIIIAQIWSIVEKEDCTRLSVRSLSKYILD